MFEKLFFRAKNEVTERDDVVLRLLKVTSA